MRPHEVTPQGEASVSDGWRGSRAPSKKIAAGLHAAIARGDYAERPKLPSAVRLAEVHGVDARTAAKALRLLIGAGVAISSPGVGTFAVPAAGRIDDRAPIDPSGMPLVYLAVADRIDARIRAGEFGEGGRLPSRHQLAAWYGVGDGSVRKAVRLLEGRGLVRVLPGKGTFALVPDGAVKIV
jgi:DNA-binding GntR family transcriptional regulator